MTRRPSTRPTIQQVARLAGASISSVSRVLNQQTDNADLVRRVHDAVRELGYVPNAIAQSMRLRKVGQVGFAVEDIGNPAYLAMVRAMQPVLRAAGIRLVLYSTGGDVADEVGVVEDLDTRMIDGLIICPIRPDERLLAALAKVAHAVVVIGLQATQVPVDTVRGDSEGGARLVVEHLVSRGCTRIALVNGPADTVPAQTRLAGYREVLARHGLYDATLVEHASGFRYHDGYAAATRLLGRTTFDAVLGVTDRLALGALHALGDHDLRCPQDVRVAGVDDSELAATQRPAMTSVNLGAAELGRHAAELMLARLADPHLPPRRVTVAAALTERETTR